MVKLESLGEGEKSSDDEKDDVLLATNWQFDHTYMMEGS